MDVEEKAKRARKEGRVRAGMDPMRKISALQWEVHQGLWLGGEAMKRLQVGKRRCDVLMTSTPGTLGIVPAGR